MIIKRLGRDLLSLFFPLQCAACGSTLVEGEVVLCTRCLYDLPLTGWERYPGNPMEQMLWGRIPLERAAAFFFFHKGSKYQEMMHRLKYRGHNDIGLRMGQLFAEALMHSPFPSPDAVIPVPLHPRKKRIRGYNQSEWIARGIAGTMGKPLLLSVLERVHFNPSQTNQTRENRWENVHKAFLVKNPAALADRHILLIDDVVTTGATLEACADTILSVPGTRISIATLAAAER